MTGSTLTMASAVDSTTSFHRSHSTPDLLSPRTKPPRSGNAPLPAHAYKSLPSLPAFDIPSFDIGSDFHTALLLERKSPSVTLSTKEPPTRTAAAAPARPDKLVRTKSLIGRPRSWIAGSRSTPNVADLAHEESRTSRKDYGAVAPVAEPRMIDRSRAVSASFADFARKSWISTSRSPSPKGRAEDAAARDAGQMRERSASGGGRRLAATAGDEARRSTDSLSSTTRALSRASVYLTRIKQKPQGASVKTGGRNASSTPSLPLTSRISGGDLDDYFPSPSPSPSLVPLPDEISHSRDSSHTDESCGDSTSGSSNPASSETESQTTADTSAAPHPISRDQLWVAFKDLDANFSKFAARKTTAQRMLSVRATLVPFLRRHACSFSDTGLKKLTPEDVERRAGVLNRWWNGLLEILDGQGSRAAMGISGGAGASSGTANLQPVSGVDRPTLLEAITLIMMRPEWRLNTTAFRPLAARSPGERVRARSNTTDSKSFEEAGSGFLEESAEHNVRTMFVTNLLTQMGLVVEKMSMRHAPLSLVSFGGKACAYAFFFVPGIAEVLVRLWGLDKNVDLIRRSADAFCLPRRSKGESEDIVALFPPSIGPLGWSSVSAMGVKLRRAAKLSLQAAKVPWHGPWVSRWRGGDTDLFFLFCKYFFILADEFMPSELPLFEKARAPAFVLLHAQLLNILDTTIHRQATVDAMSGLGPPLSEALHGADSALTALSPLLPNNLLRAMDENRMIFLLKDLLSADDAFAGARHTFAESFMCVLKAVAKRTSQFDHNACYLLCDFLQETLLSFDGYYGYAIPIPTEEGAVDYVDWPFWQDVCKMILDSNNTMSEIRMLSFLFAAWDVIAADAKRKEDLCLNWLLTEETFEKFFNNWCPMVRAYYMRLLCWRICRDSGKADELDAQIFRLVSQRLKTAWSHHLWLQQKAYDKGVALPSTAPCLPQPGKRFMIVRTEVGISQMGLFASFDSMSSSNGYPPQAGAGRRGAGSGADSPDGGARGDKNLTARKKWGGLGRYLSFAGGATTLGNGATKPSYEDQLDQVRRDMAASRSANRLSTVSVPAGPPPPPKQTSAAAASSDSDSTGSSPIYDASQFVFKFTLHAVPWQAGPFGTVPMPLRERILTRPRLPAPAQARVSARAAHSGERSESPPPPAPGLPPPTRRVSGVMQTGLVSEAKNANPAESVPQEDSRSARPSIGSQTSSYGSRYSAEEAPAWPPPVQGESEAEREMRAMQPVEPRGSSVTTSRYAGRALAEWGIVVNECNAFVDRRRDEGILGLNDVEVPTLGVEGLRRAG